MVNKKRVSKVLVFVLLIGTLLSSVAFAADTKDYVIDKDIKISTKAHIQSFGDREFETDDKGVLEFGTTGKAKRLEEFALKLEGAPKDMAIEYRVHGQSYGDMPAEADKWIRGDKEIGSRGKAKRIEGIQIRLVNTETGKAYEGYSVEYQVHMQSFGWGVNKTDKGDVWAKDGEFAGTKGLSKRLEAVRLRIRREDELKVKSVSAINSTQAEVVFNKEVKEVKPANFKVTDKDGNLVFVSKVELNEAKDVATLTFFDKFADKGIYTVEVSNVKDVDGNVMKTATEAFIYLAADVAKVEFTQTTVAPETDLKTVVKVTDKLGRDVSGEVLVEFESSNTNVVGNDGKVGVKADADGESAIVVSKVKVGDSYVKSAPTTIKVKDALEATFVGFNIYTGVNTVGTTEAFEKLEADEKADFVYVDDYGNDGAATKKLVLYYKDQYGKSLPAAENNLTVTNVTPAIVIVEADGTIKPISAGEGYVKVKANDKLEHTIKIVVRAKSEIATMELDKTDVSVVAGQEATVKVAFKDQFGTKVDKAPTVKSAASTIATATPAKNSVVIHGVKEGTTTVAVSYKVNDDLTLKETINVTVVKAGELATYEAVVDATKLDVSGDNGDKDKLPVSTDVVVNEIDVNGNKIGAVENTNITLTEVDKDGKAVAAGKELLDTAELGNKVVKAVNPGTAYVQVKVGSLVIDTLEFEVVNTKSTATTVEFDRNDLAYVANYDENKFSFKLAGSTNEYTHEELKKDLATIIKVKDQYGEIMDAELTIDPLFTNLNGLKLDSTGVKLEDVTKATATLDIVVKEIKVGNGDNLISEPVVIKVAVDAKEAIATKDVADELAKVGESYEVPALAEGESYTDETKAAAVKELILAQTGDNKIDTDKVTVSVESGETTTVTITSKLVDTVKNTKTVTVTVAGE